MPDHLHWFKWEAYTTWLTGMVLLTVIYYLGADAYLIDKLVADLTQLQAIGIGVSYLVGSWIFYELLCRSPLGKNDYIIGTILIFAAVAASYSLAHLFSGRGAYMHMGAIIGTIMVGNVFRVIMPSQRALVASIEKGEAPDPAWGARAKLHSTHNTYLTLPLLFIMISSHYPMTYASSHNWLILLVIMAITAVARQYFVLAHKKVNRPVILIGAAFATLILAIAMAPKSAAPGQGEITVSDAEVVSIIQSRCVSCHSATATDDMFTMAPGGVMLDTLDDIKRWAQRIQARSVDTPDMPFMNKTEMTDEERQALGAWIASGF